MASNRRCSGCATLFSAKSKTSKLRSRRVAARRWYSGESRRDTIKGTRCSPRPSGAGGSSSRPASVAHPSNRRFQLVGAIRLLQYGSIAVSRVQAGAAVACREDKGNAPRFERRGDRIDVAAIDIDIQHSQVDRLSLDHFQPLFEACDGSRDLMAQIGKHRLQKEGDHHLVLDQKNAQSTQTVAALLSRHAAAPHCAGVSPSRRPILSGRSPARRGHPVRETSCALSRSIRSLCVRLFSPGDRRFRAISIGAYPPQAAPKCPTSRKLCLRLSTEPRVLRRLLPVRVRPDPAPAPSSAKSRSRGPPP